MAIKRILILGSRDKRSVRETVERLLPFLEERVEVVSNNVLQPGPLALDSAEFALVFGGDGSMLSAARNLQNTQIPMLGVNLGTLGFLAEFAVEELKEQFDTLLKGPLPISRRMQLEVRVHNGQDFSEAAFNDVVVTAGPPFRMIDLDIVANDDPLMLCRGDGLIIATPTGSTAYNLSAGGPIIAAESRAIVITPICPHTLALRPIMLDDESCVAITAVRVNEGTTLSLDGRLRTDLSIGDKVEIRRGKRDWYLVQNPAHGAWESIRSKLNWGRLPKYGDEKRSEGG